MENDFLLIAQIESEEAINDIQNIVSVEGIDMLFIGPSDLSASLGNMNQFDHPRFVESFEQIEASVLSGKKLLGCIPIPGWPAERLYANGHSLVISGADTLLLKTAAEHHVEQIRNATKPEDRSQQT